jgi:hypothetical protein
MGTRPHTCAVKGAHWPWVHSQSPAPPLQCADLLYTLSERIAVGRDLNDLVCGCPSTQVSPRIATECFVQAAPSTRLATSTITCRSAETMHRGLVRAGVAGWWHTTPLKSSWRWRRTLVVGVLALHVTHRPASAVRSCQSTNSMHTRQHGHGAVSHA